MRAYLVQGLGKQRYAATQADAKAERSLRLESANLGPRSTEVTIVEAEIPSDKPGLLQFINDLASQGDSDAQAP